jgi:hypothetical protein
MREARAELDGAQKKLKMEKKKWKTEMPGALCVSGEEPDEREQTESGEGEK